MELIRRLAGSGLRKFVFAMFVISCATALCAFGRIDGTVYATIVIAVTTAFLASNVAAKMSGPNPQLKPGEEVSD
jgi:hypothetical protein